MLPMSAANQFLPTHMRTDAPLPESRVKMRVKFNGFGAASFVAGGKFVACAMKNGRPVYDEAHEFVIYESQIPEVEAMLETDLGMVPAARDAWLREVRRECVERVGVKPYEVESSDVKDWPEVARKWAKEQTGHSLEAQFYRLTGHSLRPLESMEVIERLAPPQSEQDVALARTIAAVREATGGGSEVDALKAQVAALTAQIERLAKKG